MQEKHLFEYAVIRVVPKVEREEFINVGVIVYCASQQFLQSSFVLDSKRFCAFTDELDIATLEKNLAAFERICKGGPDSGPIGSMPIASRFRWLTATRSTIVQTSAVHLGLCEDPHKSLSKLVDQLVK